MGITYDAPSNIITVTDYAEETPCGFNDLYNADKAGTYTLLDSAQYSSDTIVSLDRSVRPADSKALSLQIVITQQDRTGGNNRIKIKGKDVVGYNQTWDINPVPAGTGTLDSGTIDFASVDANGVEVYVPAGSSITFYIRQPRWGVVWKTSSTQYTLDAKLVIGDGTNATWFADKEKQVTLNDIDSISYEEIIKVHKNSNFIMGTLIDEATKATREGVQFISLLDHLTPSWHQIPWYITDTWATQGKTCFYSCSFIGVASTLRLRLQYGANNRVWNCSFNHAMTGEGPDIFNCYYSDVTIHVFSYARSGVFNEVYVFSCTALIYTHFDYDFSLKNVYARNITKIADFAGSWSGEGEIINGNIDNWIFSWGADSTGIVYRKYEFDVHCQDKDNNDLSGVSVVGEYTSPYGQAFSVSTDANGDIATQTVDHGFFDQPHGDTEQLKTPLKVTYSKAGYQTVVKYYPMDEKTKDRVVLHKAVKVFLDLSRPVPVVNLKRTDPENKKVLVL